MASPQVDIKLTAILPVWVVLTANGRLDSIWFTEKMAKEQWEHLAVVAGEPVGCYKKEKVQIR